MLPSGQCGAPGSQSLVPGPKKAAAMKILHLCGSGRKKGLNQRTKTSFDLSYPNGSSYAGEVLHRIPKILRPIRLFIIR